LIGGKTAKSLMREERRGFSSSEKGREEKARNGTDKEKHLPLERGREDIISPPFLIRKKRVGRLGKKKKETLLPISVGGEKSHLSMKREREKKRDTGGKPLTFFQKNFSKKGRSYLSRRERKGTGLKDPWFREEERARNSQKKKKGGGR